MFNLTEETIQALVSSLLPILITLAFAWLSSRNDQAKRRQVFDDAKQRIELISAYVASQNLVIGDPNELDAIKKKAAYELYDIKSYLDEKLQSMEKTSEKSENYFQRFFLMYKMRNRRARVFRVLFFMALAVSVVTVFNVTLSSFSQEELEAYGFGFSLVWTTCSTAPTVFLTLFLRWMAIRSDKPVVSIEEAVLPV